MNQQNYAIEPVIKINQELGYLTIIQSSNHQFMNYQGRIELIIGPMFSGKTSELIRNVKRFRIAKKQCLVVNYINDTRSENDCVYTHDKSSASAIKIGTLLEIQHLYKQYDVIAIDEAQFFPDLVEVCERMANNGKIVIVAGLNGTYQRKKFGHILELVPLAQKLTKLTAVCKECYQEASFTKRIVSEASEELIGGEESYKPVCRNCYHKTG